MFEMKQKMAHPIFDLRSQPDNNGKGNTKKSQYFFHLNGYPIIIILLIQTCSNLPKPILYFSPSPLAAIDPKHPYHLRNLISATHCQDSIHAHHHHQK